MAFIGVGLGLWGYNQHLEKQAIIYQTEAQYANTFHTLVSNMQNTQIQLAETQISTDPSTFQQHLRDLWRLNYASQQEIGRLPLALMPMHTTQAFLVHVCKNMEQWMNDNTPPTNKKVQKQLQVYYNESRQLHTQLTGLQEKVMDKNLQWLAVNQDLAHSHGDNQIIDGFRDLDHVSKTFTESEFSPESVHRQSQPHFSSAQPILTGQQATQQLAHFLGSGDWKKWSVNLTGKGAIRPDYLIHGTIDGNTLSGAVSKNSGHIIYFHIAQDNQPSNKLIFDVLQAQSIAHKFLQSRGIYAPLVQDIQPYNSQVYIVLNPEYLGTPVLGRSIVLKVSLISGKVIQYDASQYYDYPVTLVPQRQFSAAQLKQKLSNNFHIEQQRSVLLLDDQHHYQPAVVFDGVIYHETYRVFVNAVTGKEMHIDLLSKL
jgi:spore germination protein